MLGSKDRMPKRARFPLFLAGLAVMLVGGVLAESQKAAPSSIAAVAAVGFLLLVLSVVFR